MAVPVAPSAAVPQPELVPAAAVRVPAEPAFPVLPDDTVENPVIREARQDAAREVRREERRRQRRDARQEKREQERVQPAPPAAPAVPVPQPEPVVAARPDPEPETETETVTEAETERVDQAGAQPGAELVGGATRDLAAVPLTPPTANNGLLAVFQKRYLLKLLVRREISARYQGSFLGLLWSYIGPLAQFFVYWFVIGTLIGLHDNVENFGVHIFAGLVVVHFFTETFSAGTRSIVRNKSIVVKLPMPREMFPVASMLVSLFHVFPQLVILTIACLAYGWVPDPAGMAALLLALFIAMVLGTACALLFSAANVFFRDFSNIVNILLLFVRFSVPMIYPYAFVAERFGSAAQYYLYNPLADCVLLVQRAFWVGTTDDPAETARTELPADLFVWGLSIAGVSVVLLALGQLVFSRLESKIPERL